MGCASALTQAAQAIPAGATYEVGFSPNAGALDAVLKVIRSAKSQILVAAYSFTSKPVAKALLDAQERGVKVYVVADEKANSKEYSAATFLANQGVPVRLNGNYAIFHHKFIVADGVNLELGSFNYSAAAADKNAENVLVLWNAKPIADDFSREWKSLWDGAAPLARKY
ncbi:putative endonuclease [Rhodoferax antarcticus ANT.BR]|uniref:phospholipase D n=1 Tax=Rhodoferax antarcticus ANT.BR TaxID=1111071 RepID=A0A1Q8Y907_9BURK|nr:putative endonuclease [Rhodoferax antarcticus ANT.BR]